MYFSPHRLYLVNSPVVRADNLRFKEEGVRDVVKDVFLPWFNAYRFLMQNIQRLHQVITSVSEKSENLCFYEKITFFKFLIIWTLISSN